MGGSGPCKNLATHIAVLSGMTKYYCDQCYKDVMWILFRLEQMRAKDGEKPFSFEEL